MGQPALARWRPVGLQRSRLTCWMRRRRSGFWEESEQLVGPSKGMGRLSADPGTNSERPIRKEARCFKLRGHHRVHPLLAHQGNCTSIHQGSTSGRWKFVINASASGTRSWIDEDNPSRLPMPRHPPPSAAAVSIQAQRCGAHGDDLGPPAGFWSPASRRFAASVTAPIRHESYGCDIPSTFPGRMCPAPTWQRHAASISTPARARPPATLRRNAGTLWGQHAPFFSANNGLVSHQSPAHPCGALSGDIGRQGHGPGLVSKRLLKRRRASRLNVGARGPRS